MTRSGALYIERDSIFHKLDGSVKLLMLIAWTIFIFLFMDARIFMAMIILGFFMLYLAKLPFKTLRPLILFVVVFTILNSLVLILVTPDYGSLLAHRYTVVLNLGLIRLTSETLFFALTLSLKYLAILPITMLFIFTTHPSSFAGSLNRLGVPYKVAYAINIALRYIPDVNEEVKAIINAQEARGVDFKKGDAGIGKRMKNYASVLLPLLILSLHRVEVVSNAMDLRGFGRYPTRTWYCRKPLTAVDFIFASLALFLVIAGIYLRTRMKVSFWYAL
jgi:energy-coupling factor transport system permease protein